MKSITKLVAIPEWKVKKVSIYPVKGSTAIIEMERSKREYICGKCAQVFTRAYDHRIFDIQDLSFGPHKRVYLRVKKFRVNCPDCGIRQERLPWVEPCGRYTKRLAREVALACRSLRTLKEVATRCGDHLGPVSY
jgi:transposase